ncbi:hypothetical protein CAEBREN_01603 [Caenorhabditis brenneri]|uniref:Uncharacterized protein n=1 Tax=Caenorhabditis brenneri TaxID=135651 RepID=G0NNP7_CAEBE|nr:hypothetical protein CAEBREN_01603 [Caenorhabditis brenneri]
MELADVCVKLCWAFDKAYPCYLPKRMDEAESVCEIKEEVYPEENCIWEYMQQYPECTADHKEVFILIQQLLIRIFDLKETGAAIHREEEREVPDFEANAVSPLTVVLIVGTMDF